MITIKELRRRGRALRVTVKRSALGTGLDFDRDPLEILKSQNRVRIRELVPVRMGRMAESPFAFLRGAAAIMAHDLATTPGTAITLQACGDAQWSNFGLFASPERKLIFDLNDFDATLPGPWEWDVERLLVSLAIAAQADGLSDAMAGDVVATAAAEYRESIARLVGTGAMRRFHMMLTADALMRRLRARNPGRGGMIKRLRKAVEKARLRTSEQALAKLSVTGASRTPRIVEQPPLIVHRDRVPDDVRGILRNYRASAHHDVNALLEHFTLVDFALKVVG